MSVQLYIYSIIAAGHKLKEARVVVVQSNDMGAFYNSQIYYILGGLEGDDHYLWNRNN